MPMFKLLHGRHISCDQNDLKRTRQYNQKNANNPEKKAIPNSPAEIVYGAGDTIEAEGIEAQMMAANPEKFQILLDDGSSTTNLAEVSALREENEKLRRMLEERQRAEVTGGNLETPPIPRGTTPYGLKEANAPANPAGPAHPQTTQHPEKQIIPPQPASQQPKSQEKDQHQGQAKSPSRGGSKPDIEQKLRKMSLPELKKLAEDEEIDVKDAKSKEEIIDRILDA